VTARPRVVFEDPSLPHQIVITLRGGGPQIVVSCNCLRLNRHGPRGTYEPIGVRTRWEASEALAVWRAHVEQAGAA
jgi:hypothetical protein